MARPTHTRFWMVTALAVLSACNSQDEAPLQQPAEPEATPQELEKAEREHAHEAPVMEKVPDLPAIPEGAKVFFVSPKVATQVEGPVVDGKVEVPVVMGAEGIAVEPAGVVKAGSGHHHVLIDLQPIPEGSVIIKDDSHIHFGGGQTEGVVPVTPGHHTLTLQFADGVHRSYGPALSSSITIEVVGSTTAAKK